MSILRSALDLKIIGLSSLLLLVGCGGGDGFSGARGSVSGKVTFDGKPVPEGTQVLFIGADKGYTATGVVQADGKYSLKYAGSTNLPAIKYDVQIMPPPDKGAPTKAETDPAKTSATIEVKPPESGPFPTKYSSRTTSKLDFTVKSGSNTADFSLTK